MKRMFVAGLASILLAGQSYAAVVNVENAGINDGVYFTDGLNPGFGSSGPVTLNWDPLNNVNSSLRYYDAPDPARDFAWCGDVVSSCALDIKVSSGSSVTLTSFFLGAYDGDRLADYSIIDLSSNSTVVSVTNVLVSGLTGLLINGVWSSTVGFRIVFGNDWNVGINDITYESASVSSVPLPAALPLLGAGLGALGFMGWRRKSKAVSAS